jgi:hypothetical protein
MTDVAAKVLYQVAQGFLVDISIGPAREVVVWSHDASIRYWPVCYLRLQHVVQADGAKNSG